MNYVFSSELASAIAPRIRAAQTTFNERYLLCTPGPIYCASTDNCGGGPYIAPNNVALTKDSYEIVFRQPSNKFELNQLLEAAEGEPFDGYRFDGNRYWTRELVDGWLSQRSIIVDSIIELLMISKKSSELNKYFYIDVYSRWIRFIENDLDAYLEEYKAGLAHDDA
jgi:hypothetical protein